NIIKSTKCFYNLSLCHLTTLFIRYCFLCEFLTISFNFIFSIFVFFYLKFNLKFCIFCNNFFFVYICYFFILIFRYEEYTYELKLIFYLVFCLMIIQLLICI